VAERARRNFELACRGVALLAIALLLWRALRPEAATGSARANGAELGDALVRWTREAPATAHVTFAALPTPRDRDWLGALGGAGTSVSWERDGQSGGILPALALAVEPVPRPDHGVIVRVAAPPTSNPMLHDGAGTIDSLVVAAGGAVAWLPGVAGPVVAEGSRGIASDFVRDSLELRPVLVLGAAGWESRFTIAALEESGWQVAAQLRVSPMASVVQGGADRIAIDTANYSAVIALDSTAAARAAAIARYVRAGGGLVLAGQAAADPAFATLRAGTPAARQTGIIGAVRSDDPRRGLPLRPIESLRPDAMAIDRLNDRVTMAARRVGAGRVVQSAFEESWRWRMEGEGGALAEHREWWNDAVAGVAFASRLERGATAFERGDPAPLAALHARLGAPSSPDVIDGGRAALIIPTWLLAGLAALALLLEWASRRLRGAP
jgi:hypothetical protein